MGYGMEEAIEPTEDEVAQMQGYENYQHLLEETGRVASRDGSRQLLRTRTYTAKRDNTVTGIKAGQTYKTSYYQKATASGETIKWSKTKIVKP